MVDPIQAKVDLSGMREGLNRLLGPARESLARSMGVAGGEVIRDDAKERAPKASGLLVSAIYLAYKDKRSTEQEQVYSISWNAKQAPHGHLEEFGYWQPFVVVKTRRGDVITTKKRLPSPKWIAAHPFLRPAFEGSAGAVTTAMFQRGKERFAELLAGSPSASP